MTRVKALMDLLHRDAPRTVLAGSEFDVKEPAEAERLAAEGTVEIVQPPKAKDKSDEKTEPAKPPASESRDQPKAKDEPAPDRQSPAPPGTRASAGPFSKRAGR